MMNTRSGHTYGDNQHKPQRPEDLLLDVVQQLGNISNQLGSLNQRMDVVWDRLFDKPESSGEKAKDGAEETEVHQNSPTKKEIPHNDKVERLQFTQFTTPRHDFRSYHSH